MYYYMFSEGSYSDYCVGGLYVSETKYTYEDFKNIYKEYIKQVFPDIANELTSRSLNSMGCIYNICHIIKGYNPYNIQLLPKLHSEWREEFYKFRESLEGIVMPPEEYFVSKGLITELEYTEIWGDE